MGQKLKVLSKKKLQPKSIFNNRFVIEICEKVHTHYRNLRIIQSLTDWENLCKGAVDAYERWRKIGEPSPGQKHIELCRKSVAMFPHNDDVTISLNYNLYRPNEGKIYSEGAGFNEPQYVHFKYRDLRLEMPIDEFRTLSKAFKEAEENLGAEPAK